MPATVLNRQFTFFKKNIIKAVAVEFFIPRFPSNRNSLSSHSFRAIFIGFPATFRAEKRRKKTAWLLRKDLSFSFIGELKCKCSRIIFVRNVFHGKRCSIFQALILKALFFTSNILFLKSTTNSATMELFRSEEMQLMQVRRAFIEPCLIFTHFVAAAICPGSFTHFPSP